MKYGISQKVLDLLGAHAEDFGATFNFPEGFPSRFLDRGNLFLQWSLSPKAIVTLGIDVWGVYVKYLADELTPKESVVSARLLLRVSELAVLIDEVHLKK